MKSKLGDIERLSHILDAIEFIKRATLDKTESDFQQDFILHTAVIKWIEIIGEACYKLTRGLKSSHPNVDWRNIEGLRHVLVHEYFGIDLQRVWIVVVDYIPTLKEEITIIQKEIK